MNKIILSILAALVCLVSAPCAQAAEGTRVGVVRIQEVFRKSEYAKQMEDKIRANFRQEEKEIDDLQKVLSDGQAKLQSNQLLDRDSFAYKEQVLNLQILELKLRDRMEKYAKNSRIQMAEFWRSVYADFQKAVGSIASTNQFDLIITAPDTQLSESGGASNAPEAVMSEVLQRRVQFVAPRIDITNQVIQVMNDTYRKRSGGTH